MSIYKLLAKAAKKQPKKRKKKKPGSFSLGLINRFHIHIKLRIIIPSKAMDMETSAILASVFYIMDTYNHISTNKIIPSYVYTFDTFAIDGIISIRIWDIMKASTRHAIKHIKRRLAL